MWQIRRRYKIARALRKRRIALAKPKSWQREAIDIRLDVLPSIFVCFCLRARCGCHKLCHFPPFVHCVAFHSQEVLFLSPVGGSTTIVTVARFLFCGLRTSEKRNAQRIGGFTIPARHPCKFGSCSWFCPQTTQLNTTPLICSAAPGSIPPAEF